ncbi:MAG: hypothetical protein ACLTYN_09235 [Dysosmobacter welbionis]
MAYRVLMPQLGLTMEEGTVSQWIKHGRRCKAGDVVVESPLISSPMKSPASRTASCRDRGPEARMCR